MRPRTLLTLMILAVISFGGSFTCSGSDNKKNANVNVNRDFGRVKSAHSPRQIQFAARFTF